MEKLFLFDQEFREDNLIGVDEVGRGPLAGPVVSAAVILDLNSRFKYLDDSKKLTEKQRAYANQEIREKAISYEIYSVESTVIDTINILQASHQSMIEAINKLNKPGSFVLVDGNLNIDIPHKQLCVVKGDSKSASIAAASILAKVFRDDLMKKYALEYPEYSFEKNKGYGSKSHREAVQKYGPCDIHRRSFLKKILSAENQMRLFT